ncbi:propionyl-CoA synthetase [Sinobacterium caligoides]|uniref:Propionyl-CoA synthetase n=1 Tax=Sinobacterium caligoides TaxID=933926 RepID=A0A3N2DZW5_9GAMM|nr:propionyl-CoA synthetase [Sinobacterium caligoides]ROS04979.1 propionyl-CoA synthetase [Sinobacterium caligoides]
MLDSDYSSVYHRWQQQPEQFWAEAASDLHWYKSWDQVLDVSESPFNRWFTGAETNTCYNCVDRHVNNGRGDQTAIIYDSPVTCRVQTLTYRELQEQVSRFAGVLAALGVTKGDRVVIYMPMIPQTAIGMLACARIGAIHSVVFGGFAAEELAKRIDDARPKVILSASHGIEPTRTVHYKPLLDTAIGLVEHPPEHCVIYQREDSKAELFEGRDNCWETLQAEADERDCLPVAATDPLYILYTSGTTGTPKGVVRDNGGHMVALHWSMKNVYGAEPGEVYWAASDVGWVVGHSYIVYGPLLNGNTTVMYEGKPTGTPDAGAFWRVIEQHQVKTLFTAPTAFRVIKKEDPRAERLQSYDTSSLRALFLAGERADPDTLQWAERILQVPVIDHWWQTETSWPQVANCLGLGLLKIKHGSSAKAVPGFNIEVLGHDGLPVAAGESGALAIKLPLPPGCLTTLWQDDQRFVDGYLSEFPGYYATGDAGFIDEDGYVYVMGRLDDVMNVAGHRLSTGAMEEVIASHDSVAECAVIGVQCAIKGQQPIGLAVLKAGEIIADAELESEVVQLVRDKIGPVASFRSLKVVERFPKTRSGKILRATMRHIADGSDYVVPATIDDPVILDEIKSVFSTA